MNGTEKKILLVEDEPSAQTLYRNRLQREGFQISFAEDGEVALSTMASAQPDLVILDLMLPKVNGTDTFNRIRSQEQLKNVPILLISNAYMAEMSQKALESGATRGLLKTECTPARLVETVRDMLGFESAFTLSENLSEDKHVEAFVAAAEGALADEITLKETREEFIQKASAEVAKIREHCLAYVKAGDTPAGQDSLNLLYQQVRFFATRAGLSGCVRTALLASAFEALLFETIFKPSQASPSAPQTFAQAVDCLEHLCQDKGAGIGETIPKAKILVVDDDAVCNFAVVGALKRAHFEPVSVEDPLKAVEMAQSARYDVVFLDINMPNMSGFELCEKLRALPRYKETPMIFIASNGDFKNRAQSILSGGNDLIPKPVSPVELVLKTTMRLVHPQKPRPGKAPVVVAESPVAPKDLPVNGLPEIALLPFTVPTDTEMFRKIPEAAVSPEVEPLKMSVPESPAELPKPVEQERLTLAADAEDKLVEPLSTEAEAETKTEAPKAEAVPTPDVAPTPAVEPIKMSESPVEPPKLVEEAALTQGAEAEDKPVEPFPPKAKVETETELPKAETVPIPDIAPPSIVEPLKIAETESSVELPKPLEEEKLPLAVEAEEKPVIPAPPETKAEEPETEAIVIPEVMPPPVAPIPFPAVAPENPTHTQPDTETKHIAINMETNNKPTFDEAARGVARIMFGDENINDMNVRLTRIALERYNVPGTQNPDDVARGIARIIFGDDKLSDMNVRLTRIALERYNIADVLNHTNGSSKPADGTPHLAPA
jgi:DNA-binding response OmpR family regulator